MPEYNPPINEINFTLNELLNADEVNNLSAFKEVDSDFINTILEEAGKFSKEVFAPLNRIGDIEGSHVVDGEVKTPAGFKEAYQQFVDSGWMSLSHSPQYGGQGLPFYLSAVSNEFYSSSNLSLSLCPMLSSGAIEVVKHDASQGLKDLYLAKMVSGEWSASMCLTESHAGSDLSKLKTTAKANGDHYLISGTKIYITWGEHDMADNILHIVLAPLAEDAHKGVKGLSLFLVPKYLPEGDNALAIRNDLKVVSTEHKLGINASPTCVMSFGDKEGAVGYIIGEPGQGLSCMFRLMNHARLEVGQQGVAVGERAWQDALQYSQERIQGNNAATGEAAMIIEHADVQRMLMTMKALNDAMRALVLNGALCHDLKLNGETEEVKAHNAERFALLTPIAKAWCTELVNEVTSLGIQIHGGMGYIEETGVAQYYRDCRITSIYEGTNTIQAQDLLGRKLLMDKGKGFKTLISEMQSTLKHAHQHTPDSPFANSFAEALNGLEKSAQLILENATSSPHFLGRIGLNFLMQFGYVCGGWYHLRISLIANNKKDASNYHFYENKDKVAKFYLLQLLPRAASFEKMIENEVKFPLEMSADSCKG